jgi:hypothetical protein
LADAAASGKRAKKNTWQQHRSGVFPAQHAQDFENHFRNERTVPVPEPGFSPLQSMGRTAGPGPRNKAQTACLRVVFGRLNSGHEPVRENFEKSMIGI